MCNILWYPSSFIVRISLNGDTMKNWIIQKLIRPFIYVLYAYRFNGANGSQIYTKTHTTVGHEWFKEALPSRRMDQPDDAILLMTIHPRSWPHEHPMASPLCHRPAWQRVIVGCLNALWLAPAPGTKMQTVVWWCTGMDTVILVPVRATRPVQNKEKWGDALHVERFEVGMI